MNFHKLSCCCCWFCVLVMRVIGFYRSVKRTTIYTTYSHEYKHLTQTHMYAENGSKICIPNNLMEKLKFIENWHQTPNVGQKVLKSFWTYFLMEGLALHVHRAVKTKKQVISKMFVAKREKSGVSKNFVWKQFIDCWHLPMMARTSFQFTYFNSLSNCHRIISFSFHFFSVSCLFFRTHFAFRCLCMCFVKCFSPRRGCVCASLESVQHVFSPHSLFFV